MNNPYAYPRYVVSLFLERAPPPRTIALPRLPFPDFVIRYFRGPHRERIACMLARTQCARFLGNGFFERFGKGLRYGCA